MHASARTLRTRAAGPRARRNGGPPSRGSSPRAPRWRRRRCCDLPRPSRRSSRAPASARRCRVPTRSPAARSGSRQPALAYAVSETPAPAAWRSPPRTACPSPDPRDRPAGSPAGSPPAPPTSRRHSWSSPRTAPAREPRAPNPACRSARRYPTPDSRLHWDRRSSGQLPNQLGSHSRRLQDLLQLGARAPILAMHPAREDQLVLQRVLPAGELGDGHLVSAALQGERADDVGQVGAHLAAMDGVAPEKMHGLRLGVEYFITLR